MAALILLVGIAYIGCSLYFRFTPKLRVVVGLLVGSLVTGVLARTISDWLARGSNALGRPVGRVLGQSPHDVAVALPTVAAFVLAVVVVIYLKRGGRSGGLAGLAGGGRGKGGGGHGRAAGAAGGLAVAALCCALVLPIIAHTIADVVRSVAT